MRWIQKKRKTQWEISYLTCYLRFSTSSTNRRSRRSTFYSHLNYFGQQFSSIVGSIKNQKECCKRPLQIPFISEEVLIEWCIYDRSQWRHQYSRRWHTSAIWCFRGRNSRREGESRKREVGGCEGGERDAGTPTLHINSVYHRRKYIFLRFLFS